MDGWVSGSSLQTSQAVLASKSGQWLMPQTGYILKQQSYTGKKLAGEANNRPDDAPYVGLAQAGGHRPFTRL